MNSDSEQFEQLRKLLVLKRHEQPPPGYFHRFSSEVIIRIKAGDSAGQNESWLRRFWSALETKPMFTGAFGAAVCALVVSGIVFSDELENTGGTLNPVTLNPALAGAGAGSLAINQTAEAAPLVASTNLVSPSLRDMFDRPFLNSQQPVSASFGFPGN